MREVILAKTAGFCFGVQRAVDTVYSQINNKKDNEIIYTYGPIIHNEEVVSDLIKKGVVVLDDEMPLNELGQIFEKNEKIFVENNLQDHIKHKVIIRSHGVGKKVYEAFEKDNIEIIDATCPFVKKIHKIVEEESSKDKSIIIVGNEEHPEVQGIIGWCKKTPFVVNSIEKLEKCFENLSNEVALVSQTTFNSIKFKDLVEKLNKRMYNIEVYNTICNATEERQREARKLAADVDAMIIIGGRHSSNTQKLYEISSKECKNTYYIQTLVDLDLTVFESAKRVGITAGASTPKHIIKEVQNSMAESFEELFEESQKNEVKIRQGSVVDGKVIDVKSDEIIVDIQYKADGIVTRNEYSSTPGLDLTQEVKVGDSIKVLVIKTNDGDGQVLLSCKRLRAQKNYDELQKAFEEGTVLTATVTEVLAGGLSVLVDECKVFIPASLVSDQYEKDLEKYKNQEIQFVITEFEPKKRRVIGNRKMVVSKEKEAKIKEVLANLNEGDIVEGTVKNITSFGAFVDLGGVDGLLHISEMSWGRVADPKSVVSVGDVVKTFVKSISDDKIGLSLKFKDSNPWENIEEKYPVGSIVTGKIARMTTFGAFVELEPGVDALVHVSEIAKERVEKPEDVFKIGQEVSAKVLAIELGEKKKISLSIKATLADSDDTEE